MKNFWSTVELIWRKHVLCSTQWSLIHRLNFEFMDSKEYLISYGWKEGEALKKGGLKKPILVKHKKDKKGLGCAPGQDDSEAWWERLFDGHLKNLNVSNDSTNGGIKFKQNEVVASAVSKTTSPLYRWFVRGEGLKGTRGESLVVEEQKIVSVDTSKSSRKRKRKEDNDKSDKELKRAKKSEKKEKKKQKKQKKKEKKEKKDMKKKIKKDKK